MNDVALKNEASGEYNFSIVNNDELVLVWEGAKKYLEKSASVPMGVLDLKIFLRLFKWQS